MRGGNSSPIGDNPRVDAVTVAAVPRRRRAAAVLATLLAVLAILALPNPASAQTRIANAVSVIPAAFGQLGGSEVQLITGADLYEGQVIRTDSRGEVQVVFADDTRMVVGPNSALVIERYLMRSPDTVSDMTLNALGGSFRFITGDSPKEAYTINTPTGTIGIRGTEFDFTISWLTGRADFLVFAGIVIACSAGGDCVVIDDACSIGSVIEIDNAELIANRAELYRIASGEFRYLASQGTLRSDFRVANYRRCVRALLSDPPAAPVVAENTPPQPPPPQPPAPNPPPPPAPNPPPPAPNPPPPPPPQEEEEEPAACENNNAGLGNGPECPAEGDAEAENPGQGNNNGNGPGNNNGNGPGNNNGNGPGNNNGNGPGNNNGIGPGANNGNGPPD